MAGIPEYLKMPLVSDKIISGSRIPPMLKSLARRCKQHRRHPDDALLRPAPRLPRFIPFELQLPALKTWDPQLQLVEVVTLQLSFSLAGDGWWKFFFCFFPFEVEHRCFIPTKGCSVSTMITISDWSPSLASSASGEKIAGEDLGHHGGASFHAARRMSRCLWYSYLELVWILNFGTCLICLVLNKPWPNYPETILELCLNLDFLSQVWRIKAANSLGPCCAGQYKLCLPWNRRGDGFWALGCLSLGLLAPVSRIGGTLLTMKHYYI